MVSLNTAGSLSAEEGCLIDGRLQHGSGGSLSVVSPWSGRKYKTISIASRDDVTEAVNVARKAFVQWKSSSLKNRVSFLMRFADVLDAHTEELAAIQVFENGKLYKEMLGQAKMFGEHLRYYASLLRMPYGSLVSPPFDNIDVRIERAPLGVVAAITPWNSPLNLLLWKVGPAIAMGNAVVVKPSEVTPISTLRFAELALEAGLPSGVMNVVTGDRSQGDWLVKNELVDKIAFTGSSDAGQKIASSASMGLRKLSLELGGKSANIVFEDADIPQALNGVVAGIFGASGQTCMAGSRIFVHKNIYHNFLKGMVDVARKIRIGDPFSEDVDMGSVASFHQLIKIENMVSHALEEGAELKVGGKRISVKNLEDGYFYSPTILDNVTPSMKIFKEEVFGPVACVLPFETEDEVIRLANDSKYGLAAGIWTLDLHKANRVATAVEAGTVWVNNYRKVAYNVPFGGVKMSGIGRENGVTSLDDYSELKSVWVDRGLGVRDPFNPRA